MTDLSERLRERKKWIRDRYGLTGETMVDINTWVSAVDYDTLRSSHAALVQENERMREALNAVSRLDYLNEHNALATLVRAALANRKPGKIGLGE